MSSQTINLFVAALKGVLRELPDGASGFRVEPGALGYVTVQLMGPHGPLVACTVAQRIAPKSDGKQLTIDDAINRRSAKAVAPAPRVEKRRAPEKTGSRETLDETAAPEAATPPAVTEGPATPASAASAVLHRDQPHPACDDRASEAVAAGYEVSVSVEGDKAPRMEFRGGRDEAEWLARTAFYAGTFSKEIHRLYRNGRCVWDSRDDDLPVPEQAPEPGDTTAAEPTSTPATVADDRGEDWGEDGREYPDGRPYAELRLVRSDWQRYRRALGDAHQGDWMPDGDHRTLTVSRPQYDAIRATIQEHPGLWERVEVALLADDATEPAPVEKQHEEPAKAPLYHSFRPHPAADALASKRGRSMVFVYADGNASVEARTGEESVFFREYWSGACGWDSRDMKPEMPAPTKAKKGGRS